MEYEAAAAGEQPITTLQESKNGALVEKKQSQEMEKYQPSCIQLCLKEPHVLSSSLNYVQLCFCHLQLKEEKLT